MFYPPYYVARLVRGQWKSFADKPTNSVKLQRHGQIVEGLHEGWYYREEFDDTERAINCIRAIRAVVPELTPLGVLDDEGNLVWDESVGYIVIPQEEQVAEFDDYQTKGDLEQALHIPRGSLIDTLQHNLDEEKGKREDLERKRAENRQEMAAEIRAWTDDELVNFFTRNVSLSKTFDFLQWSAKVREEGTYKSPETVPSAKESSLEKYVRVLGLASDTDIEIKPNDPVYPLL